MWGGGGGGMCGESHDGVIAGGQGRLREGEGGGCCAVPATTCPQGRTSRGGARPGQGRAGPA